MPSPSPHFIFPLFFIRSSIACLGYTCLPLASNRLVFPKSIPPCERQTRIYPNLIYLCHCSSLAREWHQTKGKLLVSKLDSPAANGIFLPELSLGSGIKMVVAGLLWKDVVSNWQLAEAHPHVNEITGEKKRTVQ